MNFGMPQMGMNMRMMPMMGMEDDDWLQEFKMGKEEINNLDGDYDDRNTPGPKININFTTTGGIKRNLIFIHGTTIDQALKKYLNVVGRPDLYGRSENIGFLFNAKKVNFGDTTPVEVYFRNVAEPKIIVNDTRSLKPA